MKRYLPVLATLATLALAASSATPTHKAKIEIVYQAQPNGDYRLFLFGGDRALVCEEKPIQVVSQGDAVNPVVLECRH